MSAAIIQGTANITLLSNQQFGSLSVTFTWYIIGGYNNYSHCYCTSTSTIFRISVICARVAPCPSKWLSKSGGQCPLNWPITST